MAVPFLTDTLGAGATLSIEIAWGADLASDPAGWAWTDITTDVRQDPGIQTSMGRADEASVSQPAQCQITVDNTSGAYSLGPQSINWPNVRRNTPLRVLVELGAGPQVLFFGFCDGFTPSWDSLVGDIPVVAIAASGTLRRLSQGSAPVISALRRAMTADPTVVAYWPFEEGKRASYARAVRGGSRFNYVGTPEWESDSTSFDASAALPSMKDAQFGAFVSPYADTGASQVRWLMKIPANGFESGTTLISVFSTGSIGRFDVTYDKNADEPGALGIHWYDSNGQLINNDRFIGFKVDDTPVMASLAFEQVGSDVNFSLGTLGPFDEFAPIEPLTEPNRTVGIVSTIYVATGRNADMIFGHLTVQNQITSFFQQTGPLRAHTGETATGAGRLDRLGRENDLAIQIIGVEGQVLNVHDQMGPQRVEPLLELLRECETSDQGQLWDGNSAGLTYTSRRRREEGTVALTVDAGAAQLGGSFAPTDDDQRTRNKVEARRVHGVSAVFEDTDGPLGTAAIGIYDDSVEVNNASDAMALQYAGWLVHLGTVPGYRFPEVSVSARATPELMSAALGVLPGFRVDVLEVDQVLNGFPPGTVSLIVEGIDHQIDADDWVITFKCSRFSPWSVATIAAEQGDTSDTLMRPDTDGSALADSYPAGATSIDVVVGDTIREDFEDANFNLQITGDWARFFFAEPPSQIAFGSAVIGDGQTSEAVVTVPAGATRFTFDYFVSSEKDFDVFTFLIDGRTQLSDSGETGWIKGSGPYNVTGASTVTFRYTKNGSASSGFDAAFVDNLTFTGIDRGPGWTIDSDDYPLELSVADLKVVATGLSGFNESVYSFLVEPLTLARSHGDPVTVWDPRPLSL